MERYQVLLTYLLIVTLVESGRYAVVNAITLIFFEYEVLLMSTSFATLHADSNLARRLRHGTATS